jgi:uncharacterized surface protein with fasciclin (FAS1) repeats
MEGRNIWAWVGGIIVLIVVVYGIWWFMSQPAATPTTQTNNQATTTVTDNGTGVPVSVTDRTSETSASVIAGLSGGSQYASLFSSAGGAANLSGKGPYTIFVSSDAGFGLLPAGTISNMTTAEKKRFVQYSIVSGKALDIDATNSGTIQALSGDALNFHVGPTGLVQVNSSFALQEYKTSNGIVYVLNQPLLPPVK